MHPSEYLVSDLVWYDPLENAADGASRFSVARLDPPPGWARSQFEGWVAWQPERLELPRQGWKVHVSARLDEADDVIRIVRDHCVARNVAFKFLRSRLAYLVRNEKYAPRAASGKLCALYPVDDAQLEQTLRELSVALAGRRGPYILSDLRWGSGPLYLRYGGFLLEYCVSPDDGAFVPALREPGGASVPDVRRPVFSVPAWAPIPGFIADQIIAATAQRTDKLPYRVEKVLHFSNAGGVYRAVDPATGRTVVLREARPHAGLDAHETDAVSRLARERAVLERLAGLDAVPALLDHFTCWEHHYLVEEYIEGELLQHAVGKRYPLIYPEPTADELSEYVRWAMTVLGEIERALKAVHDRGVVYGDLHPFNVIVRPDGRIALVDFEESVDVEVRRESGLGAPGFVPPWPVTGTAIDEYAMNCMRLAFFLPLTTLLGLDPGRAPQLVRTAAQRFRLPDDFRDRLLRGLCPPGDWDEGAWRARRPGLGSAAGARGDATDPDRREWLSSMTTAIIASATPERTDRLFPGDLRQFSEGGVSIAHGAAGVLYALAMAGGPILPEQVDWLTRSALEWRPALPGGYGGLDGVAAVLAMLGRGDDGLEVASRAARHRKQVRRVGLYDGLAGIGLALLRLAAATGERTPGEEAARIGERLTSALLDGDAATVIAPERAGLMDGWTGVAAFFLELYEATRESRHLDTAQAAVRLDLARCVSTKTGGLQVDDGFRALLYLATGSCGIALVLRALLTHRPSIELAATLDRIRIDLGAEFVAYPGLFEGRAGLLLAGAALGGREVAGQSASVPSGAGLTEHHLRRLAWHALSYRGQVAFPGTGLQRLSMDLATGTAGVLLAAHAAVAGCEAALPLLDRGPFPDRLAVPLPTKRREEVTT
jgi:hypothetical protein